MNKKVLAVAIGAALAAPAFAQSSNVTLYGRINTAIESNHTGNGGSEVAMRSYSSRLGVRGVEDLGGGNKAVFGLESQLDSDGGNASSPFTALRNAYVGLDTGSTGRLVLGRLDAAVLAPLYNQISSVIDFVGYDAGANAFVMANGRNLGAYTLGTSNALSNGAVAASTGGAVAPSSSNLTTQNDSTFAAVQRVSNAFGYQVKLGDVGVQARLALNGPNDVVPGNTGGLGENNARNFEAAANYKLGKLTLGGGFEKASYSKVVSDVTNVTNNTNTRTLVSEANAKAAFDSRFQAVAGYDFGVAKVGALFARNRIDATAVGRDDSGSEYGLSATVPLTPKADLVANYGRRDLLSNNTITATNPANAKRTQAAFGARYNLSARTQAYAVYNRTDSNDKISNNEIKSLTVGLRHNF